MHGIKPVFYYWEELCSSKPASLYALYLGAISMWTTTVHMARTTTAHVAGTSEPQQQTELKIVREGLPDTGVIGGGLELTRGRRDVLMPFCILGSGLSTIFVYSLLGHKEHRFIHDGLVFVQMWLAVTIANTAEDFIAVLSMVSDPNPNPNPNWRILLPF